MNSDRMQLFSRGLRRSPVSEVPGYYFLTPVWGREYTQLYLDVVIPAQLAKGNLPAFQGEGRSKYIIYTTSGDAETIRAAASFQSLSEIVPTAIEIIDEEIKAPHDTMSNCFRRGIVAAERIGAAAIFLTPDLVFSDGSFAALKRLTEAGRDVIFIPGLRTLKHGVSAALKENYHRGSVVEISPRDLMRVALDNLHPLADLSWWEEGETDMVCANLYWRVANEGIVARCFHLHPLLVRPQQKNPRFFGTVDDDYFCAACPDGSRDYVVTDSDELLAVELSDSSRYFTTGIPKRSVADAASWAERSANGRHRTLFNATLRMHTGIREASAWIAAEEKARAAAVAIQARLRRPIWQLMLAGDPALLLRLTRLAQDNRLARANGLETGRSSRSRFAWFPNLGKGVVADFAIWVIFFFQFMRRIWGIAYRSAVVATLGTPVRPMIWSFSYLYQRNLRRDLAALLKDSSHVTVVCDDPKASRVFATLEDGNHTISSAACIAHGQSARFISGESKSPLEEGSKESLVIDGNLLISGRLDPVIEEASRVLKPDGRLLVFAKRIVRFSPNDDNLFLGSDVIARLLTPKFTVHEARIQGRFGSMFLAVVCEWARVQSIRWQRTRWLAILLFPLLIPVRILSGLLFNPLAGLIDAIDKSRSFYLTSLTLAVKAKHGTSRPVDGHPDNEALK